jgi:hypothetical protein
MPPKEPVGSSLDERPRKCRQYADYQSPLLRTANFVDGDLNLLKASKNAVDRRIKIHAILGWYKPALVAPLEELETRIHFEMSNKFAHSRLGEVQHISRPAHRPGFYYGLESFYLPNVNLVWHFQT